MSEEKEYKVGDEVWYVLYQGIAIKCKITEVDRTFRNKSPSGYLFYSLDEPVGHDLAFYDLIDTKEDAIQLLREYKADGLQVSPLDLKAWRAQNKAFIVKTHVSSCTPEELKAVENDPIWNSYPEKVRGVDYFMLDDV